MRTKNLTLDAHSQTFYNEAGVEGSADGLFYIERDLYKVTLLARVEVTLGRKHIRTERRLATATYGGEDPEDLAILLRDAGFEPPDNLAELCETRPWQVRKRAKKGRATTTGREDTK